MCCSPISFATFLALSWWARFTPVPLFTPPADWARGPEAGLEFLRGWSPETAMSHDAQTPLPAHAGVVPT